MSARAEGRLVWVFCFFFNEDRHRSYFFLDTFSGTFIDMFKIRLKSGIPVRSHRKQPPHHFGVDGDIDTDPISLQK